MLLNYGVAFAEAAEGAVAVGEEMPQASTAGSLISTVVMMVLMILVFYFVGIRPQRKKEKAVRNMLSNLKVGDRVCTIGGFYGTIAGIKEDTVTLTMGSQQNVVVIKRSAIGTVENIAVENDDKPEI